MKKFRALTIHAKALIRDLQGSPELLDEKHLFYEAERLIKKHGWEDQAYKFFNKELDNIYKILDPIIDEYLEYKATGEKDENKEKYFRINFQKTGVDGSLQEELDFLVNNDRLPTEEEFNEIMNKREEEDNKNAEIFFENQAKIAFGEEPDIDNLIKATKHLKDRGLFNKTLAFLPNFMGNKEMLSMGYTDRKWFRFRLY